MKQKVKTKHVKESGSKAYRAVPVSILLSLLLLVAALCSACQNNGGGAEESAGNTTSATEPDTGSESDESGAAETEKGSGQAAKDYSDEVDVIKEYYNYERPLIHTEVPNHLTEQPMYVLSENATEEDARAMILKAMMDNATFPWTPAQDAHLMYDQTSTGKLRINDFPATMVFGGMPYSGGARGVLQVLEYYDYSNGVMHGLDFSNINACFGNSCAAAVNWAVASVCPGVSATSTFYVTPSHGYQAIGEVELPNIKDRWQSGVVDTPSVINRTDEQVLYRAYALSKPADVFLSIGVDTSTGHAMICLTAPEVTYRPDGSIDPDQSTLTIIDQWTKDYKYKVDGQMCMVRGRIGESYTFTKLKENDFIAVRPKELANWTGYVKGESKADRAINSLSDLRNAHIVSNYRLAKLEFTVTSESGTVVYRKVTMTESREQVVGTDRNYPGASAAPLLSDLREVVKEGRTYQVALKSLIATGETFVVAEFPLVYEDIN